MGRKGKKAGTGHMPLTHYERTKKFASSEYGTTTTRLTGDTQVAFGHCSLSLAPIMDPDESSSQKQDGKNKNDDDGDDDTITTIAMVTPSGHLYGREAIYEYLLTKTQDYHDRLEAYQRQQKVEAEKADTTQAEKRQRQEAFDQSQQVAKKSKYATPVTTAAAAVAGAGKKSSNALKQTSYWLPDMQPAKVETQLKEPERPSSPYSGQPLRRKDLKEVALSRKPNSEDVLCAISGKPIKVSQAIAYWTKDKTQPGVVALKEVFEMTVANTNDNKKDNPQQQPNNNKKSASLVCPLTNVKIKHTIELASGGSGFAAHNAVEVKTYKPTIT